MGGADAVDRGAVGEVALEVETEALLPLPPPMVTMTCYEGEDG